MVNANSIGDCALRNRDDGSSNDGGDKQASALSGECSETVDCKRENAREHNGVEQSYEKDAEHCHMSGGQHGDQNQGRSDARENC